MEYQLGLQEKYFRNMKYGSKKVEIRLFDEKRKKLNIGDTIYFLLEPDRKKKIQTKVTNLMKYKNYSIEESEQRGYKKSARTKEKKIYQWDQNGNFIAEYQSARDADQKTGISYKNLSLALNGKNKTAGGFLWTFTNKKPIIEKKKRIVQYDIEDNLIAIYDTQTEAGRMTAIDPSGIGKVIHGKRKTCGGYKWKEEFL